MTVSTTTNKIQYTGDGTANARTFPFKIYQESDLVVISREISTGLETTLTLNTDYTVSGVGGSSGSVTPLAVWPATHKYTIKCILPLTQESNLIDNDSPAETIETQLDRQTKIAQQLQEQVDRGIKFPPTFTGSVYTLPSPEANKAIGWDASGSALCNLSNLTGSASAVAVTPYMLTLLDDTSAGAARTTLGVASKTETDANTAVSSAFAVEHTAVGAHALPYWPQPPTFGYTSGDAITIGAGAVFWKNKVYHWDSDLTFNLTSAGSNADSGNIGSENYQFIYADWSKSSASAELSAGCFRNTSAAPTWNGSAKSFMNGDDLYLGHFLVVTSAIAEFYHCCGADNISWSTFYVTNINGTDVDTTFVDCQFKNVGCGKITRVMAILYAPTGAASNNVYYRKKGASTSQGDSIGLSTTTAPSYSPFLPLYVDENGKGQVKRSVSNADVLYIYQHGHFLLR